jgi:hypothetical protein
MRTYLVRVPGHVVKARREPDVAELLALCGARAHTSVRADDAVSPALTRALEDGHLHERLRVAGDRLPDRAAVVARDVPVPDPAGRAACVSSARRPRDLLAHGAPMTCGNVAMSPIANTSCWPLTRRSSSTTTPPSSSSGSPLALRNSVAGAMPTPMTTTSAAIVCPPTTPPPTALGSDSAGTSLSTCASRWKVTPWPSWYFCRAAPIALPRFCVASARPPYTRRIPARRTFSNGTTSAQTTWIAASLRFATSSIPLNELSITSSRLTSHPDLRWWGRCARARADLERVPENERSKRVPARTAAVLYARVSAGTRMCDACGTHGEELLPLRAERGENGPACDECDPHAWAHIHRAWILEVPVRARKHVSGMHTSVPLGRTQEAGSSLRARGAPRRPGDTYTRQHVP